MKTKFIEAAATIIVIFSCFVAPAQAAPKWQEQAWKDMRSLGGIGVLEIGRANTMVQINRTCRYLNSGYSAASILDNYMSIASQSARSQQQLREMNIYNFAVMVVAAKRLCPRHMGAVSRVLGL